MEKLFIIGNGFDVAHNMPTKYDPNFKDIARKKENGYFWDLYQTQEADIWAKFETLLGYPDYNMLEYIFNGYEPDMYSDHESDRDGIILQAEFSGNLETALYEFAAKAEASIAEVECNAYIENIIDKEAYYVSFNYTHTLEDIYCIPPDRILHIHGEVGLDNLKMGYPEGSYNPEKYNYDVRQKGVGPYVQLDIEDYINGIENPYVQKAYEELVKKCKSFYKEIRVDLLKDFLDGTDSSFQEIIVYGHSCDIDFDYFQYINSRYPCTNWTFYVKTDEQEISTECLIENYNISNTKIIIIPD